MRFVAFEDVAARFRGKPVAIVGSGPGVLSNDPGFVDSHDVVLRVSDYKTSEKAGYRCDVHYSFYGNSIRKDRDTLKRDGVTLCVCKLPNSKPIESQWHVVHGKPHGIDYRYIYETRAQWWWCDTFIPDDARFLEKFELLGKHSPTTGFAAILDVLDCKPRSVYLTGFDFFTSGLRNVDEPWRQKNTGDPICHRPDLEAQWIADNAERFTFDRKLSDLMAYMAPA
jgi:hypothetical protein